MNSFTETTLLLVLGLACVVALVLLPFKEDEDASGIRARIRTRVTGSHRRGEPRQAWVPTNTKEAANVQQRERQGTVATVLRQIQWNRNRKHAVGGMGGQNQNEGAGGGWPAGDVENLGGEDD